MDHVLDSLNHVDGYLMKKIADKVYDILETDYTFPVLPVSEEETKSIGFGIRKEMIRIPEQLSSWLQSIKRYKGTAFQKTGAIVMNCNPFTLGHRYLIEQAYMQVDRLLIFVVEEDRSFFKYKDRFEMVRIGVEDLPNVIVLPSGKFIISAETLPGYFEKEDNPEIILDASLDLHIFAEFIAKELNIKIRFAGEEPTDLFTKQYNIAMEKIEVYEFYENEEAIKKLEELNFITRSKDEKDKRVNRIYLTAKAINIKDDFFKVLSQWENILTSELNHEEKTKGLNILNKISQNLINNT